MKRNRSRREIPLFEEAKWSDQPPVGQKWIFTCRGACTNYPSNSSMKGMQDGR